MLLWISVVGVRRSQMISGVLANPEHLILNTYLQIYLGIIACSQNPYIIAPGKLPSHYFSDLEYKPKQESLKAVPSPLESNIINMKQY